MEVKTEELLLKALQEINETVMLKQLEKVQVLLQETTLIKNAIEKSMTLDNEAMLNFCQGSICGYKKVLVLWADREL